MNEYVATFFTHYDALVFIRKLTRAGIVAHPRPVPRRLSSSCGTCVGFALADNGSATMLCDETVEQLALTCGDGYKTVWDNRA